MKAQFADFLRDYDQDTRPLELFFPYANGYHLMELSSYLRYRGFQLVGQSVTNAGTGHQMLIESRRKFPHDRCVFYQDYTCTQADSPRDGALIVVLPDDNVSMDDVENAGQGAALVFSIKAHGFCTKRGSWFRLLNAISPEFSNGLLPEHWLQLHVFKKGTSSISSLERRTSSGTMRKGDLRQESK
jgi:hypothetical protein